MSEDAFFLEIQDGFLQEAADILGRVEALSLALEKDPESEQTYAELARLAHNFKGSGKAVGFDHISKLGHRLEDFILAIKNKIVPANSNQLDFLFKCLDRLTQDINLLIIDKGSVLDHESIFQEIEARLKGEVGQGHDINQQSSQTSHMDPIPDQSILQEPSAVDTVDSGSAIQEVSSKPTTDAVSKPIATQEVLRIPKSKIDFLLEAFGEQVILQSSLEQAKFDLDANRELIFKTINQLTKLTFELQSHALALTMVQLGPLFTKLERAIRDAARSCNKTIEVELEGVDTEVDKTLIDSLSDSLTHMVRNSVDHAIEDANTRKTIGKNEKGSIKISAKRSGGQLWIEVSDDGKGLDPEALKKKALEKGIVTQEQVAKMNDIEAQRLIFLNGFSTKEVVSEVSGRGVGMNVVEESVRYLKGAIDIISEVGKGTTFRLKLPLSLAIFNGAVVRINENKFVIPNSEISEIGRIELSKQTQVSSNKSVVKIREEVFDLVDLRQKLGSRRGTAEESQVPILISRKQGKRAYVVDEILGMQKIVQKPLGLEVIKRTEYAAGTILGDGTPGVILNLSQFDQGA